LIYVQDINLTKSDIQVIGSRKDTLKFEKFGVSYIKFFAKDMIEDLNRYNSIKLEIVGKPTVNEWMGRKTPQIMIENYEVKDDEWGF
jgi:single-stranded-DNA-specific exonuclease